MIETFNIEKSFGKQRVLDGVSLKIQQSEAVAIIGRSGCGKSILLKHLIGLLQPDKGRVVIEGADISRMSERDLLRVRHKFGMLFQSAALFDSMTVFENIAFPLRRERKWSEREITAKVDEALEMVDLPGAGVKKPAQLSGGMRKRVGLARAIVYRPEVILYDEPTTGLDPVVSDSIDHLILRVCEILKVTTIVVTHDMRSVRTIAQRVLMLHQGKIYAEGSPADFFKSSDSIVHKFVNGISDAKDIDF